MDIVTMPEPGMVVRVGRTVRLLSWVYGGLLVLLSIGGLVIAWRRRQRT